MKDLLYVVIIIVLAFGGYFGYQEYVKREMAGDPQSAYVNTTFTIDGEPVTLAGGRSEVPSAPDSSSKTITQYFGNDALGDLNYDGKPDATFIVTQNAGGSGTFYYVVAAIKTDAGYTGTNAILLGDRIAPQSSRIVSGQLILNYAERAPADPMTTPPSVGVTRYFSVHGTTLVETQ